MKLPTEEIFREVCSDVVIRFNGHDAYNGRAGALRAFRRRAPDYDASVYENAFDNACEICDLAVVAIKLFPAQREKKSIYSEFEDINYEKCMQYMGRVFPDFDESIKTQILNWVIFWHYLK